jgi:arsenite-transporting ATPase
LKEKQMNSGDSDQQEPAFLRDAELNLLLFGGKGGVGKTTCAAAAALSLAQRHPESLFLLVSTDPAHSLLDCLAGTAIPPNLTLREIDPEASLACFKHDHESHLRTISLRGTFLDEADVTRLLDISMPGLDEIMALLEISGWVKAGQYACIVVDTAPAGHTLRLLSLPNMMMQWVQTLDVMLAKHRYLARLYRGSYQQDEVDAYLAQTLADLNALSALLQSPAHCRFVPVMLAESLSIHITQQMLGELARLALPVSELIVNRLHPVQPDCAVCTVVVEQQSTALAALRLAFGQQVLWGVPLFLAEMQGSSSLLTLWAHARLLPTTRPQTKPHPFKVKQPVHHPAPLPAPSIRLMMFAGKGGVGKTTLSCASALHFAEQHPNKKTLLFSIDPAHSLAACLGCELGAQPVQIAVGLSVVELDAAAEFALLQQEYAEELRQVFDHATADKGLDVAFDRDVLARILDIAPPGLDEVLALTRIVAWMEQGRYDVFVLDTAPTGHLLRFLEMPELIEQWLKAFFALFLKYRDIFWLPNIAQMMVSLSRRVKLFRRVLFDAEQAMLVAVTIPTEMAYAETVDLLAACARLGVATPLLLVNNLTPASACPVCTQLRLTETRVLAEYDTTFASQHRTLVFRQATPQGIQALRALGAAVYGDKQVFTHGDASPML